MVVPSSLSPRARVNLAREQPHAYNAIYAANESLPVWERLLHDAHARQTRPVKHYQDKKVSSSSYSIKSGFVSNTVDTFSRTRPSHSTHQSVPVESLHPIQAKRMKQREPIEFMASIRPTTQTTNQTLRMMGTYETDLDHARRFKIQVPEALLTKNKFFHPDVIVDKQSSTSTKVHPKWQAAESSGHFNYIRTQPNVNEPVTIRRQPPPGEIEVKGFRKQGWRK